MSISSKLRLAVPCVMAVTLLVMLYSIIGNVQWQFPVAVGLLAVCIFLVLTEFRGQRSSPSALGHLLHLRCRRHPSVIGYCGYEKDFVKYCTARSPLQEVIFLVAQRHPSGRIYAAEQPGRHHHVISLAYEYGDGERTGPDDQGFVTSFGRYVNRQQAWEVAKAAGQIKRTSGADGDLYSEDVWAGPLLSHQQIEERAWQLVLEAYNSNKVVTIETVPYPDKPLAMGNYQMVPHVRSSKELWQYETEQQLKAQARQVEVAHG